MLSYQLARDLRELTHSVESLEPLLSLLAKLSPIYGQIITVVDEKISSSDGNKINEGASQMHSIISSTHGELKGTSSKKVFLAQERLLNLLRELRIKLEGDESDAISRIIILTEEFGSTFDSFLSHQNVKNAWILLKASSELEKCSPPAFAHLI